MDYGNFIKIRCHRPIDICPSIMTGMYTPVAWLRIEAHSIGNISSLFLSSIENTRSGTIRSIARGGVARTTHPVRAISARVSIFPGKFFQRKGRRIPSMTDEIAALTYVKKIAQFSFKKKEDIDEIVRIKLREALKEAVVNCGFYKNRETLSSSQFLSRKM